MSSEYSFCSENGFDEMSSSSDSGFDVSFESSKHDINGDQVFQQTKDEKKKKTRNTRCKSPQQVIIHKIIKNFVIIMNCNFFLSMLIDKLNTNNEIYCLFFVKGTSFKKK